MTLREVLHCDNPDCVQVIRSLQRNQNLAILFMGGSDSYRNGDTPVGEINLDRNGEPLLETAIITLTPAVCASTFIDPDRCAVAKLKARAKAKTA